CAPEARSEVAHHVVELTAARVLWRVLFIDRIVPVFEIPIVDERHQYPQAVELTRSAEAVLAPTPSTDPFLGFQITFQSGVAHRTIRGNQVLSSVQAAHTFNAQ